MASEFTRPMWPAPAQLPVSLSLHGACPVQRSWRGQRCGCCCCWVPGPPWSLPCCLAFRPLGWSRSPGTGKQPGPGAGCRPYRAGTPGPNFQSCQRPVPQGHVRTKWKPGHQAPAHCPSFTPARLTVLNQRQSHTPVPSSMTSWLPRMCSCLMCLNSDRRWWLYCP